MGIFFAIKNIVTTVCVTLICHTYSKYTTPFHVVLNINKPFSDKIAAITREGTVRTLSSPLSRNAPSKLIGAFSMPV